MTIVKVTLLLKNCNPDDFKRLRGSPNVLDVIIQNYESEEILSFERELENIFI
jgi:hypothetical protein